VDQFLRFFFRFELADDLLAFVERHRLEDRNHVAVNGRSLLRLGLLQHAQDLILGLLGLNHFQRALHFLQGVVGRDLFEFGEPGIELQLKLIVAGAFGFELRRQRADIDQCFIDRRLAQIQVAAGERALFDHFGKVGLLVRRRLVRLRGLLLDFVQIDAIKGGQTLIHFFLGERAGRDEVDARPDLRQHRRDAEVEDRRGNEFKQFHHANVSPVRAGERCANSSISFTSRTAACWENSCACFSRSFSSTRTCRLPSTSANRRRSNSSAICRCCCVKARDWASSNSS
jgi:hypothetical protein